MKAYKGFDKNLKCKDFQYSIGGIYKEPEAELCGCGFHACENPLDVFHYYPPGDNRYAEVELYELDPSRRIDSKVCGKEIHVGEELSISNLISAAENYIMGKVNHNKYLNPKISDYTDDYTINSRDEGHSITTNEGCYSVSINKGDSSVSTNTRMGSLSISGGDYSISANTGVASISTNVGRKGISSNSGVNSVSKHVGDDSVAVNTGEESVAVNSGEYSMAVNTGGQSLSTNSGCRGVSINTGKFGASSTSLENTVSIATGIESKAKAGLGGFIVLAEWCRDCRGEWYIKDVKSAKVDGKEIKADTFYILRDGKFMEVD